MFPRAFEARRLTCRTLFFVACILPTTAIVVLGAWRTAPFQQLALRDELSKALAVGVALADVTHPRPGVTRIEGLLLSDPETGDSLLSVPTVEVRHTKRGAYLTSDSATLHTARAGRLYEELHRRMANGTNDLGWKVRVDDLTLHANDHQQTNVAVTASSGLEPSGPVVDVRFGLIEDEAKSENSIKLIRNRDASPAETTIFLQTGGTPLPCSLLGQFAAEWNQLGDEATFVGSFWTIDAADGRRGEMIGVMEHVDLQQLVPRSFGHNLSGKARVRLAEKAIMQHGRLQLAKAHIDAGPGSVSQQLLEAANRELQMPLLDAGSKRADGMVSYQRLVADVTINRQGMLIRGQQPTAARPQYQQPGQHAGVVLAGPHSTILVEPRNQLPVTAVLRTLAMGTNEEAMLSGPVASLAKWLPESARSNPNRGASRILSEEASRP